MEIRSSRRLRTLVTQMALRGLSANEIAGALIPMMARARRSNQRPDTLMQDRYRQLDEILLLRTDIPPLWGHVRYTPKRGQTRRRSVCPLSARRRHVLLIRSLRRR